MKKQYIQPTTAISKMISLQTIICASQGENSTKSTYVDGNSGTTGFGQAGIEIGTKERNEWGNIGGDDMTYGSIW